MHGHGFKHESHRNPSSNPFKAHSLADAFIFTSPCPRFSNSIVHPSGEQRTLIRSTLRFSMQLKKLPPPPLHSKESALLLLFECLSKCHPLSLRSAQRISYLAFFLPFSHDIQPPQCSSCVVGLRERQGIQRPEKWLVRGLVKFLPAVP